MKGFSYIELILVVAIMLIISSMAPIFYSRFLLQNAVANTVDQLSGSLRKAQIYSLVGRQNDSWSVNLSNNTITVFKGTDFAARQQAFDEKFSVNPNVSVTWVSDVKFAKLTGAQTTSVASVTISSGNNSQQISVNSEGVVSR